MKSLLALVLLAPSVVAGPANAGGCAAHPWADARRSPDQRARALLAASTQHQKYRWLVEQPANNPRQTEWADGVVYPEQLPCTPTVVYTDGPDGVRFTSGVTAFPATLATASTWNLPLAAAKGEAQAAEAYAAGKNVLLAPGLAGGRTPLSGRTPEYLGEDPLLTGLMAAAGVRGIQASGRVGATLKHYVANEQELDRQTSSSNVDERTLREIYELPFEIAVKRSRPAGAMCSYNQINGVFACENPRLRDVLKRDMGFGGYVMSDFGSVHSTAPSLVNGLDQELNRPIWFTPARLDAALAAGTITQALIDAAAYRVVRSLIAAGLFDHPLPAPAPSRHPAVAREVATQGSVLLKNDGLLPLAPSSTVAVIGATAADEAQSVCSLPWRFGGNTLECDDIVTPLTSLRERGPVLYHDGADVAGAAAVAARADVAVVFGHQRTGEFADLADLRLQDDGDALISAVAAANPRTVVVLQTGSAVQMPWLGAVPAVLETWYAGSQMGPALAALLHGDEAPSGKLPMTFPRTAPFGNVAQYPGIVDGSGMRQVSYREGRATGYRSAATPLFPFGHGLSYTTFAYRDLHLSGDGRTGLRIAFTLANTGTRRGTEVAQAYLGSPSERLVGWSRVTLDPGRSRRVTITLTRADLTDLHLLSSYDPARGAWLLAPGRHTIGVGGSSATVLRAGF